jgi:aerobic-type carbon monoxide dehydrogenase small subunit (CoxS/CutS family)
MSESEDQSSRRRYVSLTVNGNKVAAEVDCRMTLAEFLREKLDLTGTKVGCNRGGCGSCTVILDEKPVYSCTILAVEAKDKKILTIEGLSRDGTLHPLQEAFVEEDALQCGYCTPGMIMALIALMNRNPHPTEEDVKDAIDGNLCRCGSYPNIIRATLKTSQALGPDERIKG